MSIKILMADLKEAALASVEPAALCYGANLSSGTILKVGGVFALSKLAPKICEKLNLFSTNEWFFQIYMNSLPYACASYILTGSGRLAGLVMSIHLFFINVVLCEVYNGSFLNINKVVARTLTHGAMFGVLARISGYDNRVALAVAILFAGACLCKETLTLGIDKINVIKEKPELMEFAKISLSGAAYCVAGTILRKYCA